MSPTDYHDDFIPQDTREDEASLDTGVAQPLSEAEIEELLYGEGRSVEERLRLLRELRNDIATRASGTVLDDDPAALTAEIDDRIAELQGEIDLPGDAVFDVDPLAHRETLAPDSDELEELEDEDEDSLDEEDEWLDSEDREAESEGGDTANGEDFEDDDDEE
jgi:hypothetical protein